MGDPNETTSNPDNEKQLIPPPENSEGKRRLPLISQVSEKSHVQAAHILEEVENAEQKIVLKIAHAFLKNPYPLSLAGKRLKEQIQKLLENKDVEGLLAIKSELPTVESPHLELFADLDLPPEEVKKLLGPGLANIQVTKGCSHKCDFCAAGAEGKVTFMPYAAILKMAEEKKTLDTEMDKKIIDYCAKHGAEPNDGAKIKLSEYRDLFNLDDAAIEETISKHYGQLLVPSILSSAFELPENPEASESKDDANLRKLRAMFLLDVSPIKAMEHIMANKQKMIQLLYVIAINQRGFSRESTEDFLRRLQKLPKSMDDLELRVWNDTMFGNFQNQSLNNYYDSDPFDYRDSAFLHEDGTPADFGDVVDVLGSQICKIYITTAGWSIRDKVAQRAAGKVAQSPYIDTIRISINSSEIDAKKDQEKYVAKMKNVIKTLEKTFYPEDMYQKNWRRKQHQTQILLFNDSENSAYQTNIVDELKKYCKDMKVAHFIFETNTSEYSGHIETESGKNNDHDVMACMPGHHIWPDGTIADQKAGVGYVAKEKESTTPYFIEAGGATKGSRPTPTGRKLFHTEK